MPESRPNVLLICADHWGGLFTRMANHPVVMTPTIAALARQGVTFTNAYSTEPTCVPARRSLMTGLTARSHGDRVFKQQEPMPSAKTMPQAFRDAGYQAYAVGKLHVYPPRDRIGFDEVLNIEEGRRHIDRADDWELYLADHGYAGQEFASGLANNDYIARCWHLPEHLHPTNWAAEQTCRAIRRRDPTRPAFWYLSFIGPHPPLWPPRDYFEQYRDLEMDPVVCGDWSRNEADHPHLFKDYQVPGPSMKTATSQEIDLAKKAFYAAITHIDHQIRSVIGTLREEGELETTIIAFTSDHGEMLGDHGQWSKSLMYEMSAKVPLVVLPTPGDTRLTVGTRDDRLVALRDIMPTLLDLAGVPIPDTVEGMSLVSEQSRGHLYGEHWENDWATRMVHDGRYKLIYYATGNQAQLFDLHNDPRETRNLAEDATYAETRQRLLNTLVGELYGSDRQWLNDAGELVGLPWPSPDETRGQTPGMFGLRGLSGQRGRRYL